MKSLCLENDVYMSVGFGSPWQLSGMNMSWEQSSCTKFRFPATDPYTVNAFFSGVDSVGTISASLVTYASIQALKPDLIINAGTAGAFKVFLCAKLFDSFVIYFPVFRSEIILGLSTFYLHVC